MTAQVSLPPGWMTDISLVSALFGSSPRRERSFERRHQGLAPEKNRGRRPIAPVLFSWEDTGKVVPDIRRKRFQGTSFRKTVFWIRRPPTDEMVDPEIPLNQIREKTEIRLFNGDRG